MKRSTLFLLVIGAHLGALAACGGPQTAADEVAATAEMSDRSLEITPETPLDGTSTAEVDLLRVAVEGAHRDEDFRARDAHRRPYETLSFFGIEPGHHVVEISPGLGWYTEILGPYLREEGHLTVATFDPNGPEEAYLTRVGQMFAERMDANPDAFGAVDRRIFAPPEVIDFGEPGSVDAIVTFRNIHGWHNRGTLDAILAAALDALKPGGVLGVVQHRSREDARIDDVSSTGYLPEDWVIQTIVAAGFELDDRSEHNSNPADTKDHPNGVWSLPPTLRLADGETEEDAARYAAIGETDRMTLRFRKPAEEAGE